MSKYKTPKDCQEQKLAALMRADAAAVRKHVTGEGEAVTKPHRTYSVTDKVRRVGDDYFALPYSAGGSRR